MSSRSDDRRQTELENQAHAEAVRHFAEQLKLFPVSREAVERVERNLSIMALAANIAAAKPSDKTIQTDDGMQWHKSVELMDNTCLCSRPVTGGVEYAVVEHFPARGSNEIWNHGLNAVEVLRTFAQEQRQALQIWTDEMTAQVKEFLAQKYPGQDTSRTTVSFMHRFMHSVSPQHSQSPEQNHNRGLRI